MFHSIL